MLDGAAVPCYPATLSTGRAMQTGFSAAQRADPAIAQSAKIIGNCVHCGICLSACPTYSLLGNELDSPRGRIFLAKEMLESGVAPSAEVVKHFDRCLSCGACSSACPSGVDYALLVDHARSHIEKEFRRPFAEQLTRTFLAHVLPYPIRLRLALFFVPLGKVFLPILRRLRAFGSLTAMLSLASRTQKRNGPPKEGAVIGANRVLFLRGCVDQVLTPETEQAVRRLLSRAGYSVDVAQGQGCCGALVHHMGRERQAHRLVRHNVNVLGKALAQEKYDAIIVAASGCGTMLKDYGRLLRDDERHAECAARISGMVQDISEFLSQANLPAASARSGMNIAYHAPCSLQHGQRIRDEPKQLLRNAGYTIVEPEDGHLCCGSAGTFNLLQPEIADALRTRKCAALAKTKAAAIASGNIGCTIQIAAGSAIPVVHTVELLDWAMGGPRPVQMRDSPLAVQ